jgi:hypothetical protein
MKARDTVSVHLLPNARRAIVIVNGARSSCNDRIAGIEKGGRALPRLQAKRTRLQSDRTKHRNLVSRLGLQPQQRVYM